MTRLPRYLWLAFAGLALAGLAPSTARASCGHYVLIGSPLKDENGKQASAAKPSEAGQAQMPVPMPPGPRPCSGPGCSQGHKPLLPLPTPPPSAEEEHWGHHSLAIFYAEHPTDFLPLSLGVSHPVRLASSIYHPPRSS